MTKNHRKHFLPALALFPVLVFCQSTTVAIENGTIEGSTNAGQNIRIFKGIPFAPGRRAFP